MRLRFPRSFRKSGLIILLGVAFLAYRNNWLPQPGKTGTVNRSAGKNAGKARRSDTLYGTAVRIKDGDTFVLLTDDQSTEDIRMLGIDAPEKKQDFGSKSKDALGRLLRKGPLTVVVANRDRYGRAVASVYDAGNRWVNEAMVRQGMAWMYRAYSKDRRLSAAEAKAKAGGIGLWSQSGPTPPWEWRKSAKAK